MIQSLSAPALLKRTRTTGIDRRSSGLRGQTKSSYSVPAIRNSLTLAEFQSAADGWLLDGTARLSPKTVYDRRVLVGKLLWWLQSENCTKVGRVELARFFAYLPLAHLDPAGRWGSATNAATTARNRARQARPLSPVSCANYFRWLRTLFLYLVNVGVLDESPMRTLRPAVHRPDQVQPFSPDQVAALLAAARKTEYAARDVAILLVLIDTGARAAELCGIKSSDFNARERSIRVLGKGSKHRVLYLSAMTLRAVQEFQRQLGNGESEYLFGTQRSDQMAPAALMSLFHRLGRSAGLTGVRCSPHTARHTFAIEFLRAGGDPLTLQMMLGHTDLSQTRRYVAFAGADIKRSHAHHSPVAAMKLPSR